MACCSVWFVSGEGGAGLGAIEANGAGEQATYLVRLIVEDMRDTRGASITGLPRSLRRWVGSPGSSNTPISYSTVSSRAALVVLPLCMKLNLRQVEMVLLSSKPGIAMLSMLRLRSAEGLGLANCIAQRASVSFCGARPSSSGQISRAF